MTTASPETPVFDVRGLRKQYGGLRPLRLQSLVVPQGAIVALMGLDQPAAEVSTLPASPSDDPRITGQESHP